MQVQLLNEFISSANVRTVECLCFILFWPEFLVTGQH
jgi:hypothetical protein